MAYFPIVLALVVVSAHAQFIGLSPIGGYVKPQQPATTGPLPATAAPTGSYKKPFFCHDLDCPKFSVIEKNDKFEVRRYEPSMWVATKKAIMLYSDAERRALFYKLFHYIDRNNSAGMKIPMTAPVVTEIEHGAGPDCESNFTMHFFIPFNLQANPPAPVEAGVFIRHVPEITVIVKSYGGFDNDDLKRTNLIQFIDDLNAANKQYEDRIFFTASYDGPYQFVDRTNEIWVVAK